MTRRNSWRTRSRTSGTCFWRRAGRWKAPARPISSTNGNVRCLSSVTLRRERSEPRSACPGVDPGATARAWPTSFEGRPHPEPSPASFETPASRAPQDEGDGRRTRPPQDDGQHQVLVNESVLDALVANLENGIAKISVPCSRHGYNPFVSGKRRRVMEAIVRRLPGILAALATIVMLAPLPAAAQSRIALVVGNGAYARGAVTTSLADAGLVAEALNSIGFEIVEGADFDQAELRRTFRDFLARVEAAGPDAIAFVYLSGYGVEFEGENYLLPVDARLTRDTDIPLEAVRISDLVRPLAGAAARAKLFVLDASRPLPFTIEVAPGLAATEASPGMLIAYSAAPGTFAQDTGAAYGAYANAMAE